MTFRHVGDADVSQLQALFERCTAFFELTEGVPPAAGSAAAELQSRAPGKTSEDTFCFGVFQGDRLAAFLHVTRDFPTSGEWWIGLMLVDPDLRGLGIGAETHDALCAWASANGARVMRLGVLAHNTVADRFWRRRGYSEQRRQPYVSGAGHESTMIVMSMELPRQPAGATGIRLP